jgi:hypothetical protein
MAAFAVVVALNPESKLPLDLSKSEQGTNIFIEVGFKFEHGKKFSTTALSQQQPLADMLQLISYF